MPVLLDYVELTSGERIEFKYRESTQLNYKKQYCADWGHCTPAHSAVVEFDLPKRKEQEYLFAFIKSVDDLKWNQLSEIKLIDSTKFILGYTYSQNERLKLESLTRENKSLYHVEEYQFKYNTQKLPQYISGHYDHLGFYNGADFSQTFKSSYYTSDPEQLRKNSEEFYELRKGDTSGKYLYAEMLERIIYPTGGFSQFEYEPNVAPQILEGTGISVHNPSPIPNSGGLRIKRVVNYDNESLPLDITSYYYINWFDSKTKTGFSSGILAFTPRYFWDIKAWNYLEQRTQYAKIFTSGSSNQSYYNLEGTPYVGYSLVIECKEDINGNIEGYTKYRFSNNENSNYFDQWPIKCLNDFGDLGIALSPYIPFVSNAKKRGKLLFKAAYDKNDKLKQMIEYTYQSTTPKEIRDIDVWVQPGGVRGAFAFGGSCKRKLYN